MSFSVTLERDEHQGLPWEEYDMYGIVSEWTARAKAPGEMILSQGRGLRRYYDFAASTKKAKKQDWGPVIPGKSKKESIREAVLSDFNRLKDYCDNKWTYMVLIVTDDETGEFECIGGLESDDDEGIHYYTKELEWTLERNRDAEEINALDCTASEVCISLSI